MKQVIVIHGGDSFAKYEDYFNYLKTCEVKKDNFLRKYNWKVNLGKGLGDNYEVLVPKMPNSSNAVFDEWKIWFERMFEFLDDEIILVGHSLGGMFLAKYLGQNDFPKKIKQLHLVAPPHNLTEDIADFFLPDSLENVSKQAKDITLYFSKDDPLVPFSEMDKYEEVLTGAKFEIFEDRGHFKQESFPELISNIKESQTNN